MDGVYETLEQSDRAVNHMHQGKYMQSHNALRAFFESESGKLTESGSERTNIIDRGRLGQGCTYEFSNDSLAKLLVHVENCRREGAVLSIIEKQGNATNPYSGIMLDYDIALKERPDNVFLSMDVGGPVRKIPEVITSRARKNLCSLITKQLIKDLIITPSDNEVENGMNLHFFFIMRPEVDPIVAPNVTDESGAPHVAYYKYGFHILIPGIQTSRGYKKYLIEELRKSKKHNQIIAGIGAMGAPGSVMSDVEAGDVPVSDCLDSNSASVPTHFFGSCKPGGKLYMLGAVVSASVDFDDECEFMGCTEVGAESLKSRNLCYEMSLWARPPIKTIAAVAHNCTGEASELCYEPFIVPKKVIYKEALRDHIESLAERSAGGALGAQELRQTQSEVDDLISIHPKAKEIKLLLGLLDSSYPNEYTKWRNVIYVLNSSSQEDTGHPDTYYPLAAFFSQMCPEKWNTGGRNALRALWDNASEQSAMRKTDSQRAGWKPMTRRSLAFWARNSSPNKYREVIRKSHKNVLKSYVFNFGGSLAHSMVADVLYSMLSDSFVVDCPNPEDKKPFYQWFEFVSKGKPMKRGEIWKWRPEGEPDEMNSFISNTLGAMLGDIKQEVEENFKNADSAERSKYFKDLVKKIGATHLKLYDDGFKRSVINQAKYKFRRRGFIDELNTHPHILGVANGVLHVASREQPKSNLISSFHEWPVSKFTPVDFKRFDPTDEATVVLLDGIRKIIPEIDMRIWLLMYLSTGIFQGLKEPRILFLEGAGSNAKTFLIRMTQKALGQYAIKLNIGLLVSDREASDRANSALMQVKGHSFGYLDESNRCEKINVARFKELVNAGDINGRDLRDKQENFQNTCTLVSASNYPFIIDTTDHGTWRRISSYTAKAKFCPDPDPNNPYEHKDDKRFVQEFVDDPQYQTAWLSILNYFWEQLLKDYQGDISRVPCQTLDRETENYRNSQDTLNKFVTENIVISQNSNHKYALAEIASRYCDWYQKNVESSRRYVATEIMGVLENSALSKYLTSAHNGTKVLTGCRLLSDREIMQPLNDGEKHFGSGKTNEEGRRQVGICPDSGLPEPVQWWNWRWGSYGGCDEIITADVLSAANAEAKRLKSQDTDIFDDFGGVAEDHSVADGAVRRAAELADVERRQNESQAAAGDALDGILDSIDEPAGGAQISDAKKSIMMSMLGLA